MKIREIPPQYVEKLFYIEGGKALEQTAQGRCEASLSLETFKIHLDTFQCHLL